MLTIFSIKLLLLNLALFSDSRHDNDVERAEERSHTDSNPVNASGLSGKFGVPTSPTRPFRGHGGGMGEAIV